MATIQVWRLDMDRVYLGAQLRAPHRGQPDQGSVWTGRVRRAAGPRPRSRRPLVHRPDHRRNT